MKKSILNNDVEKLNLLKAIDSKLERAISIFERVADDQIKIHSLMIQQNQNQAYPSMPPLTSISLSSPSSIISLTR